MIVSVWLCVTVCECVEGEHKNRCVLATQYDYVLNKLV